MSLLSFFSSHIGRLVSCFIVGLGLSIIFWNVCNGPECVIIRGPPTDEIKDKVFKFDSKCYTYNTVATSCKKNNDNNTNDKINQDN